jgi:hypothetical protein
VKDGKAIGYDMNLGTEYPAAFEAEFDVQGPLFEDDAVFDVRLGKGFEETRKGFNILGEDSRGKWAIEGHFRSNGEPPEVRFLRNRKGGKPEEHRYELEGATSSKTELVAEYLRNADSELFKPELSAEDHFEIMRGMDAVNQEIGLYDEDGPEMEKWLENMEYGNTFQGVSGSRTGPQTPRTEDAHQVTGQPDF